MKRNFRIFCFLLPVISTLAGCSSKRKTWLIEIGLGRGRPTFGESTFSVGFSFKLPSATMKLKNDLVAATLRAWVVAA